MHPAFLFASLSSGVQVDMVDGSATFPEVAVCIAGAARSFATVSILRALKKNVLQNPTFSATAFAAISNDTASPQALEYNASLLAQLSAPNVIRRALMHLKPQLKEVAFYDTSDAHSRFQPCHASDGKQMGTTVPALYSMQLCFGLVRRHEVESRRGERFDFVLRVRPDHLFVRPLGLSLGRNVSSWPRDRVLAPRGAEALDFALVPSGPLATLYFSTFTHAQSCLFRAQPPAPLRLPDAYERDEQCAQIEAYEGAALGACVLRANLRYHSLPPPLDCPRPALLARVCNLNASTGFPAWPVWPMPRGVTCVTKTDQLKRPRPPASVAAVVTAARAAAQAHAHAAETSWHLALGAAGALAALGAFVYRRRLCEDGREALASCQPLCPDVYAAAAPLADAALAHADHVADAAADLAADARAKLGL